MENKRIIFTNDYCEICTDEAIAEKQCEYFEESGELISEEKAAEWLMEDNNFWFEDELHMIEDFIKNSEYSEFLAVGSVGRWNGTFAGGKVFHWDHFTDTMWDILTDCDEFTISDVNGILRIEGIHHDGGVSFDIKGITKRGYEYYSNWEENWNDKRTEQEVHEKMWNDSHYTHVLHFADKVYGKITKHKQKKSVPVMA